MPLCGGRPGKSKPRPLRSAKQRFQRRDLFLPDPRGKRLPNHKKTRLRSIKPLLSQTRGKLRKREREHPFTSRAASLNNGHRRKPITPSINQLLRNLWPTIPSHIKHQRIRIHLLANRLTISRPAMSSQRHATRNTAQRQRPLQSRRTSQRSSNPRHHLILDPRRLQRPHLLIGTPKQHRIAALQANHNRMFLRRIHNLLVDELLRRRQLSAPLAHRNLARMRRVLKHRRFDQRVVQHDIRQTQQSRAPNRDEIRGPWPCTDQIHLTHLPQPHSYGPSQTPGRERTPG